jgi:wyosine [tRNA(Phe)-imidazoG37] synthetase (radical SAM superfamily)
MPVEVFGPVPSRRLGRSLGVNHIPPKSCSYSCVYCQVGPTRRPEVEPRPFFDPAEVVGAVERQLAVLAARGEAVDYVTLVPDGEPTLDAGLADILAGLRRLGPPVAVISNASLLWRPEVREALAQADWVSLKVDSVDEALWRRVNRPAAELDLARVHTGMRAFAREYGGTLATETMLVAGLNDAEDALARVAGFVADLAPAAAYLTVPIRPPAEASVAPPGPEVLNLAYQVMAARLPRVELLSGYESEPFGATGDAQRDLLAIAAVHPMREESVAELLERDAADWSVVRRLLDDGRLSEVSYRGRRFYLRRPHSSRAQGD